MCAVAGLASCIGTRLEAWANFSKALARLLGFPAKRAPVSSARYSLEREMAIWMSIAAKGATIDITIRTRILLPPSSSFPPPTPKIAAQRAMLAAALIKAPRLLIADEPLSGLDSSVAAAILATGALAWRYHHRVLARQPETARTEPLRAYDYLVAAAGLTASVVALTLFPRRSSGRLRPALAAFLKGIRTMVGPVFILLAAWILGSVIGALGTAELIAAWAADAGSPTLLPSLVFLTGAVISFATGTSWGTMGLLFPLVVPAAVPLRAGPRAVERPEQRGRADLVDDAAEGELPAVAGGDREPVDADT